MNTQYKKAGRRNGVRIMSKLIVLVKPLFPVMIIAVAAGVLGFLCAIFLTIIGGQALVTVLQQQLAPQAVPADAVQYGSILGNSSLLTIGFILSGLALMRGLLHCIEQYSNHYIAFKLLAIIRSKVFTALRALAPAKLEGRDKGNLISIITTDIELLEVFYAHTISPILIAILTSLIMLIFIGYYSIPAMIIALIGYITVGVWIPLYNGKKTSRAGMEFRNQFGDLNSYVLESLRGLDEIIQYAGGSRIQASLQVQSKQLAEHGNYLSVRESLQRMHTNTLILLFSTIELFFALYAYQTGLLHFGGVLAVSIGMSASFGPVLALAQLSNNLHQTLASGERVLHILEEEPQTAEVPPDGKPRTFTGAAVEAVRFAYQNEIILDNYSMHISPNTIIGIHGASGSGKSTLLKLLMRFWDVQHGQVTISGETIRKIPTNQLRDMESYVTQESHLFKGTVADNIRIAKPAASLEEITAAAKKASIHDFIISLPQGYDTPVGELGSTLSGGEKQRIGLARAFLHDAPFLLLDEPTSNLDILNEKIILKSLKEAAAGKTVILVSHRESTLSIAGTTITMGSGRKS
ncbi:MAG: amino acid ABC transporter ATP-binding/permease protein [Treponema sp.]